MSKENNTQKCDCWRQKTVLNTLLGHEFFVTKQYCVGTQERDECDCDGMESKCSFYEHIRKKAERREVLRKLSKHSDLVRERLFGYQPKECNKPPKNSSSPPPPKQGSSVEPSKQQEEDEKVKVKIDFKENPSQMINEMTVKEFRDTGLLLYVNQILQPFGVSIASFGDETIKPVWSKYRGFSEEAVSGAYDKINTYLKNNISTITDIDTSLKNKKK